MSILNETSLNAFLKNGAHSLKAVLFYGQDDGLIDECRQKSVEAVVGDVKDPFRVVDLKPSDVADDVGVLNAEANAVTLMGGRRVVRIRDADNRMASSMKLFLAEYTGDALIVLTAGMLTKGTALRTLFEKAENAGVFACYSDEGEKLKRFAAGVLAENGLHASPEVVACIADNLGADRMMSRSELMKLVAYTGDKKEVTVDDVNACIGDASVLSTDNFLYALSDGNFKESQKTLEKLYAEGTAPIALLRAAAAHFKRVHATLGRIDCGETVLAAMNALVPKIHFKRTEDFKRLLRLWTVPKVVRVLDILTETEIGCKTKNAPQPLLCARAFLQIASLAGKK